MKTTQVTQVTRFSEDVRPVSDLKRQASSVIDRVVRERRPTLITRRGKGVAVIINLQEYEKVLDELAFTRAVKEGLRDEAEGRLHPHSEAVTILDRFGRSRKRRDESSRNSKIRKSGK